MASVHSTALPINQSTLSFKDLPVELVDEIVSLLSRQDILTVRLAHPDIAAKSYRAFANIVLGSGPSFNANKASYRRLAAICRHPEVSKFIKRISLDTGCPGRRFHRLFDPSKIGRALSKLPNLMTLDMVNCISEGSPCSPCSHALLYNIHIATLQRLCISLTNIDSKSLALLISHHWDTLEVVELKCVTIMEGSWTAVLGAISGLRKNAKVEIFAPCECDLDVWFVPKKDDPDAIFIRVVETRRRHGGRTISYNLKSVHKPNIRDGISRGIQCMLRSYRLDNKVDVVSK
jgi:hypothetical protein